jgi:alcohol dehydrogenase class IV
MNPVTLLQPPRIVFGNGCFAGCAELLTELGSRRVLVIHGKSAASAIDSFCKSLRPAGCSLAGTLTISGGEPTREMFEIILAEARKMEFDAVLGIGGGSVLDVAKLVAALTRSKESVSDVFGINRLAGREIFLMCVATTAGTGSEVSPIAVLLDEADELKKGVVSPHLVPDIAIIDPLLTVTVPAAVTAATGVDALTHCLEAYANKFAHPIVDLYALQGIRLIAANLLRAVRDGGDSEARANVALGSLYGGLCLGPVGTAGVHALAYPLGGQFHIAHGVSNAVLLPHVVQFNLPLAAERYAEVARALGVKSGGSAMATAEAGVKQLVELSRACGVPQSLSALEIPREAIPGMAKAAMQVTRLLKNNPRAIAQVDAEQIYTAAF